MPKTRDELKKILDTIKKAHDVTGKSPQDLWRGVAVALNAQIEEAIKTDLKNRISSLAIPDLLVLRELTDEVIRTGLVPAPDPVHEAVQHEPKLWSEEFAAAAGHDPYHVVITDKETGEELNPSSEAIDAAMKDFAPKKRGRKPKAKGE